MKPKTTVFLIVILILCVGYIGLKKGGWFEPSASPVTDKPESGKIFPDSPSGAKLLTVASADGDKIVFLKEAGKWKIIKPLYARADESRINKITDMLLDMEYQREIKAGQSEADNDVTGLDKPCLTVTLVDQKDVAFSIAIGKNLPLIGSQQISAYVACGDRTFVVRKDFSSMLDKGIDDYRSKTILDIKSEEIALVAVLGSENYELTQSDKGWRISKPLSARADGKAVAKLIGKLSRVNAIEFVDDAPSSLKPYGLENPSLIVRIEMKCPRPLTVSGEEKMLMVAKFYHLALGRTTDDGKNVFARLKSMDGIDKLAVFKLASSYLKDLQPKLLSLRDKRVLAVLADDVVRMELELPLGKTSLVKQDGKWRITSPLKGPADGKAVADLLAAIASLRADDFIDDSSEAAPGGLDKPVAKIKLSLSGKKRDIFVMIGGRSSSGEMTFVKSSDIAAIAVVPTSAARRLVINPANFWDPMLLELLPGEKVTHLEVHRSQRPAYKMHLDKSGKWKLFSPLRASGDRDNINRIIDRLEKFKATRITAVAPTVPAKYTKAKKKVVLEVTTRILSSATTKPATQKAVVKKYRLNVVKIGLRAYGWIEGRKISVVGEFALGLYDVLAAELRNRQVWSITPDDVSEIRMVPGIHIRREGKQWISISDRYAGKIDAKKVKKFLGDIRELKALRFVTHQPTTLSKISMAQPWLILDVTTHKGVVKRLIVATEGARKAKNRYAKVDDLAGMFLLSSGDIAKLAKLPKDFKK